VGWRDATVARLLLLQAAIVAAIGSAFGGLVAWWFLGAVFEARTPSMAGALLAAAALAVLVSVVVTLVPVRRLRMAPVGRLLSEE
jgi:ABC-type antimicrobial peptide transport system permease subunit